MVSFAGAPTPRVVLGDCAAPVTHGVAFAEPRPALVLVETTGPTGVLGLFIAAGSSSMAGRVTRRTPRGRGRPRPSVTVTVLPERWVY